MCAIIVTDGLSVLLNRSFEELVLEFEWDANKAETNLKKHSITFSEAASIFGDPFEITISDPDHSADELRFISISTSTSS